MPQNRRPANDTVERTPGRERRPFAISRLPWLPVAASLLVMGTSAVALAPVRDAVSMAAISEAYLVKPAGYVAVAPFSAVLDTIALLSVRQHIALLFGLLALLFLWRAFRHWRGARRWRSHAAALGAFFLAFVLTYAAAVLLPRPMAYLASQDPNVMRVDFHSHTSASRDARRGFSVQDNREWHRRAGYDVVFITDHATVEGAERGIAGNTVSGLDDPMLLQGIEATWTGEHVAILGAQRTYTGLLTENMRDVDPDALRLASLIGSREPVVVWNHPRDLGRLVPAAGPATAGIRAVEIANGSPDNMDDVKPKRAEIAAFAQRHNLALTTGTDNHGWGYTAPAWTLMRPPGWRGLTTDQLALQIEAVIRDTGIRGTLPVERTVAYPSGALTLSLTVITVPLTMLRTLSADERVMWLLWIWAVWGAVRWAKHRRARA